MREHIADYSWIELKRIARAITVAKDDVEGLRIARFYHLVDKDGKLQGDTKPLTLADGTKTSVRILGFRHDRRSWGGKAGISFEFADVPLKHRMNATDTRAGGWEASEMRKWLNAGFLALMPNGVRRLVEPVKKRANNTGKVDTKNDVLVVSDTTDRIWLLSMSEVYGRLSGQKENRPWSPATYDAEGTQYQFYADKGVTTRNFVVCIKRDNRGAYSRWWLRSPGAREAFRFLLVVDDGDWIWSLDADYEWGVSPGFCF